MIDIKLVRTNPELVKAACDTKNAAVGAADVDKLIELDEERRALLEKVDNLRRERNELSGGMKGTKPSDEQIEKGKELKEKVAAAEAELATVDEAYIAIMRELPNIPTADVPIGRTEDDNVLAKTVGDKTHFDFEPKNHWQLAEVAGWIDKERAAKVAGSRFAYIKGSMVKLQFALMQYTLDVLMSEATLQEIADSADLKVSTKAFEPVLPPSMARTDVYDATARLDGEEQTYKLAGDDLWLNASAEHTLVPMYKDEILPEDAFPIRYIGYTTAFRREAGTYGKDMEGILRLHQFDKLEMESFTVAENGFDEHLLMVAIQEYLLTQLGLPYQVIMKCTADIGKANARGVDMDVWLPGQDKYRETHTADYMTDYQSRRLQTRVRRANGDVELVHTNDATAFALGRIMIAIIENYQTAEGQVHIPQVLRSYYGAEVL